MVGGPSQPPPPFATLGDEVAWGRRWQAQLAAGRWVGIHWPRAYGGRGASPLEVAIFNTEYARARAPQPVNRVGINLTGPTLLAHGTEEQKERYLPSILSAEEIWCQLFSEPGAGQRPRVARHAGHAGRRRVGAQRAEGVDVVRPVRPMGDLPGPDRPGRAQAPRHLLSHRRHDRVPGSRSGRWCRSRARPSSTRSSSTTCSSPTDCLVGGLQPGVGGGQHDAGPRAGHQLPVQGAGGARGVPRRALPAWPSDAGRLDDPEVADALAQSYVELRVLRLHNWRTMTRLGRGHRAGPGVERGQAGVDGHVAAHGRRRPSHAGTGQPAHSGPGSVSGCGARRPASPAARRRCSARSSASASSACPADAGAARRGRGVSR